MAMILEQRHANRFLKGQVYANLVTLWVYIARAELWRNPYDGSGPSGAKGKEDNNQ